MVLDQPPLPEPGPAIMGSAKARSTTGRDVLSSRTSRGEQTWGLTLKQRKTLKKWPAHVVLDTWDRVAMRLGVRAGERHP